jgi:flagellar hook protein FlgE
MNAYSRGLQTISNNVANLNTLGFKATTVNFTDLFSIGGGGLTYSSENAAGFGTNIASPLVDFRQGDLRQTGNDLDLSIQGSGFFVLLDGDKTYYTRTGQFTVDEDGFISEVGTKYHLGIINQDGGIEEVNIDRKRTSAPQTTTRITFADNLSSSATQAIVDDVAVYDSLGGKHIWTVTFTKGTSPTAGASNWDVTVKDSTGATIGTSTLSFIGSIVDPATTELTVTTNPEGADPLTVKLDFASGVTSFSSGTTSTLRASDVDGHGAGALTTVSIDADGKIKLAYSNDEEEVVGAIAVADFRDPQSLQRVGQGLFVAQGSGQRRILASGVDGVGKILSKQLEASNVDLSQEFGELILIQRGFQASSQVVSVSNDMIQQLFGIRGQG